MSEAAVLDAPADTSADSSTPADNAKPADTQVTPPVDAAKPDAKADATPDGKADAKTTDTPIEYSFKLPDGMELDKAAADEFVAFAKELKLPADQAQKVVDIAVRREQARIDQHKATVAQWALDVKNDKEIGGDKLTENLAIAKKAFALGPPELKEYLDTSGLGNHPALIKWALKVGKALSEDRFVGGVTAPAEQRSQADILYPKTK